FLALVLSHAVNGTFYSQGLRDGQWLTTISKYLVPIWVGVVSEGNSRRLDSINGQVRVLQADIPVDNGVIHVIDRPINPTELVDLFKCESDFL
uniref:FAS1 domain-containing protein n=1 Tax=Strigamia maritima TaxID=126957 RepID=T1JE54_STRMM